MEREKSQQRPDLPACGEPPAGDDLDQIREKLGGIHGAADEALKGLSPIMSEDFLQQSRQRGAQ